jgi:hypothetical protein
MNAGERWEAFLWLLDEREAIDLAVARDERSRDAAHERWNRRRDLARQAAAEGRPLAESRLLSSFVTGFRQTERELRTALLRAYRVDAERAAAVAYLDARGGFRRPRWKAAADASERLRERTARRVRRTAELTDEGRTATQIGRIIASEEGEEEPHPETTVKGWRRRARDANRLL